MKYRNLCISILCTHCSSFWWIFEIEKLVILKKKIFGQKKQKNFSIWIWYM